MMIIIMCDTETTALSPAKGKLRELAYIAVRPTTLKDAVPLSSCSAKLPTARNQWCEVTAKWAGVDLNKLDPALCIEDAKKRRDMLIDFEVDLRNIKETYSKEPIVIVFQHPEFDIPFLEAEGIDVRGIFGHRNVFDLASLLVGWYGRFAFAHEMTSANMIKGAYSATKPDHSAMGDVRAQLIRLQSANWAGLAHLHEPSILLNEPSILRNNQ